MISVEKSTSAVLSRKQLERVDLVLARWMLKEERAEQDMGVRKVESWFDHAEGRGVGG